MEYVIGVDGGSTKCLVKAKNLQGDTLAETVAQTTNHHVLGEVEAGRRADLLITLLLEPFGGRREDCRCVVAGAAGIDSPNDRMIVDRIYHALGFRCPVFCMNDGMVALYAATKGTGMLAICGTGSIVVGRSRDGKITRSGGHPITIMGEEGSGRWLSAMALNHMAKWVDKSVPSSALVRKVTGYFGGFDENKLNECAEVLYRCDAGTELAPLVYEAAQEGDGAAVAILEKGAGELFGVAQTVVEKLGFARETAFLSGMWGSVFVKNEFFAREYQRLFTTCYPGAKMVFPGGDAADGAADMALDYLRGRVPFIRELV